MCDLREGIPGIALPSTLSFIREPSHKFLLRKSAQQLYRLKILLCCLVTMRVHSSEILQVCLSYDKIFPNLFVRYSSPKEFLHIC